MTARRPDVDAYGHRLQRSNLEYIRRTTAAATSLAENDVGLPTQRPAAPA